MKLLPLFLATLFATSLAAQPVTERVLLPLYLEAPVPGAFGSLWVTELAVHNGSAGHLHLAWCAPEPDEACILDLRGDEELKPGETQMQLPRRYLETHAGGVGAVVYVSGLGARAGDPKAASYHLRILDTSRSATNAGTEVPVVREPEWRTATTRLHRVPVDARFRATLRVYEMELPASDFEVRIYSETSGALLRRFPVHLTSPRGPEYRIRFEPAYAEITDFVAPGEAEAVRVEIEPLTPGVRFWGFVSITNNETQHVTLLTPQ